MDDNAVTGYIKIKYDLSQNQTRKSAGIRKSAVTISDSTDDGVI